MDSELTLGCNDLSRKHPRHSLAIRRLALRDPRFREVCEDYGQALRAAEAYRAKGPSGARNADELQQMAEDLCDEALDFVEKLV